MQCCHWWQHQHHVTGNILWQYKCQKLTCTLQLPHINQMCQLCQYICLMSSMQSTFWSGTLIYIHFTFWHMLLNKCACDTGHIYPTALLLWSSYRPHITVYTSTKIETTMCNRYSKHYCQICVRNKYAPQMSHMQISSCSDVRQLCQYLHHAWTSINIVARNIAIHSFHLIGICPWTNIHATCHMFHCTYSSLHIDPALLHICNKNTTDMSIKGHIC